MSREKKDRNLDQQVIDAFGHEWASFNYPEDESDEALDTQFSAYMSPIDLMKFDKNVSIAADFGAGSGRWTSRLVPFFSKVFALEPSDGANKVLVSKFSTQEQIKILHESIGVNSIPDHSLDFAMSLGVLHHIPDTLQAMRDIAQKVKPGGIFLCYLYYNLDNKPFYYRGLFWASNFIRFGISRLPFRLRLLLAKVIAAGIYLPLARISRFIGNRGRDVSNIPLHHYANLPFVMLQNDALDRFGTRLEQRFSRKDIVEMIEKTTFDSSTINFSNVEPFWTFSVTKL